MKHRIIALTLVLFFASASAAYAFPYYTSDTMHQMQGTNAYIRINQPVQTGDEITIRFRVLGGLQDTSNYFRVFLFPGYTDFFYSFYTTFISNFSWNQEITRTVTAGASATSFDIAFYAGAGRVNAYSLEGLQINGVAVATPTPTPSPTAAPTATPSPTPTPGPTATPSPAPTAAPTFSPPDFDGLPPTFFTAARLAEFWGWVRWLMSYLMPMMMIAMAICVAGLVIDMIIDVVKSAKDDDADDDFDYDD